MLTRCDILEQELCEERSLESEKARSVLLTSKWNGQEEAQDEEDEKEHFLEANEAPNDELEASTRKQ